MIFSDTELGLIAEALRKSAARHDSQSCVTKGHARADHDEKAILMRRLYAKIIAQPSHAG